MHYSITLPWWAYGLLLFIFWFSGATWGHEVLDEFLDWLKKDKDNEDDLQ
jgi:amino acid permease